MQLYELIYLYLSYSESNIHTRCFKQLLYTMFIIRCYDKMLFKSLGQYLGLTVKALGHPPKTS